MGDMGRQRRPFQEAGGAPWLVAEPCIAGGTSSGCPSAFSISQPCCKGLGTRQVCQLPGLLALFPAIYQASFPALVSLIYSFVPVTALKHICSWSGSIPLLQCCLSLGPWAIWHLYHQTGLCQPFPVSSQAVVGWMGHSPALCRDAAAAMVAFAE